MYRCEIHNEEKHLIGSDCGRPVYRCNSCYDKMMQGLRDDFKELEKRMPIKKTLKEISKMSKSRKFKNLLYNMLRKQAERKCLRSWKGKNE